MDTIDKIKHEIKMKDIKKTDLAKHLGVTPQRLNNWLLRKNIPFEYISQIAEFLGVSTDYLLNNKDNVKNKLEYLLNKKGKSQTDLANYLGVDLSTITAWKKRNSISKRYISKVAEYLNVSINFLLEDKNNEILEKIDLLLSKNNLTRSNLARDLNISPQRVNNWFSRKKIPFDFIPKIAKYFDINIDEFLNNKKTEKTEKTEKNIIYIKDLPPEIGAVVKYMLKLDENEKLEFMSCIFSRCKKEMK